MTNFERWKSLEIDEFIKRLDKYSKCNYKEFVDWDAYFQGDKDDFSEYLKVKYYAKFNPSEIDIAYAKNEAKIQGVPFDEEKYIAENIKTFRVLQDDITFCGTKYVTVFDTWCSYTPQLIKIPETLMIEREL